MLYLHRGMVTSCPSSTFLQAEVQFLKIMHVMVRVQQINYLVMIMVILDDKVVLFREIE